MAFDVITYILSKKYTQKMIESLPTGFHYKGAVNTRADLEAITTKETGDVYTVLMGRNILQLYILMFPKILARPQERF